MVSEDTFDAVIRHAVWQYKFAGKLCDLFAELNPTSNPIGDDWGYFLDEEGIDWSLKALAEGMTKDTDDFVGAFTEINTLVDYMLYPADSDPLYHSPHSLYRCLVEEYA